MDLGLIVMIFFFLCGILLALLSVLNGKFVKEEAQKRGEDVIRYGRDIRIGFVSGIIVLILDKGVVTFVDGLNKLKVDTSSLSHFIASFTSVLVYGFFALSLMLYLVSVAMKMGLPKR